MGKTMTEKILGKHAGRDVKPNEFAVVCLDLAVRPGRHGAALRAAA